MKKKKTEYSILTPTNPYAATKAGAEMIAMSYNHSYNMPIIVTRGNNVYGPRQYPEKLIPKFIKLLKGGNKLTIHGNGENKRSFLYVDDVTDAFVKILENGEIGEIYNIGSEDENEYSVMEVTEMLVRLIKKSERYENYIEYVKDRNFNDKRYYIDNNKLKGLGWLQKTQFKIGLVKTIKWYENR